MIELKENEILVMRDVHDDMTSYHGCFKWPEEGPVEAPDWNPEPICGGGLHGLPWGKGSHHYRINNGKVTLLVAVDTSPDNYVHGSDDMTDKCKFRRGRVVFCGSQEDATKILQQHAPADTTINWSYQCTSLNKQRQVAGYNSTQTAGDYSTQEAGNESTQTAGDYSMQTAGNNSAQTAGNNSTQTAGDYSIQKAYYCSTQKAGHSSTQEAGHRSTQEADYSSTQTAGYCSTQKANHSSTQKAGDKSTQTAGDHSIQVAGNNSIQTAGEGTVQIGRWYGKVATRTVTEKMANKPYLFKDGEWTPVNETCKPAEAPNGRDK